MSMTCFSAIPHHIRPRVDPVVNLVKVVRIHVKNFMTNSIDISQIYLYLCVWDTFPSSGYFVLAYTKVVRSNSQESLLLPRGC